MGVVYIGDRATGKTALALELIDPKFNYVSIVNQNYQNLKKLLFDEINQSYKATQFEDANSRLLEVEVKLPAGTRRIPLEWIDTPGEMWRRSWQAENTDKWQSYLNTIQQAEGILLVLPPYREMTGLKPHVDNSIFPTLQQWCNRFRRWADFFKYQCPKARHLVICLNKADLFSDLEKEAYELAYHPQNSRRNWFQRNTYVRDKYFRPVLEEINSISNQTSGLPVRCFITTIYQRSLLELPWVYLASHLAS